MKLFKLILLLLMSTNVFMNRAFAGGVETIHFATENLESIYIGETMQPVDYSALINKAITIDFNDSSIAANVVNPETDFKDLFDGAINPVLTGGVETIVNLKNLELLVKADPTFSNDESFELAAVYRQPEHMKYIGETKDSVIIMFEGAVAPVEIKDYELNKSKLAIDAIHRAAVTNDWVQF